MLIDEIDNKMNLKWPYRKLSIAGVLRKLRKEGLVTSLISCEEDEYVKYCEESNAGVDEPEDLTEYLEIKDYLYNFEWIVEKNI